MSVARSLAAVALVFATGCAGSLGPVEFSEGSAMKAEVNAPDDSRRDTTPTRKWSFESAPRRSYGEGAPSRGLFASRPAVRRD